MMCTLLAASTCTLDTPYFVHRHMPAMSRQTVLHHWLLFTLSVVCLGHMGNEGAAGISVAALLEDLHNDFCGCRAIDGNIRILMSTSFPDFNSVSLTEANFTFFNEITEVSGYIFLQNIPTLSLLTFPRLRLIRGTETFSHPSGPLALVIADSNIVRLFMPRLTEITNGGVIFANPAAPLCSAAFINWSDITSSYTGPDNTTCTGQGNTQSLSSAQSLPSLPCLSR